MSKMDSGRIYTYSYVHRYAHFTLSRSAAAGRMGPAQATNALPPLSAWPCVTLHGAHEEALVRGGLRAPDSKRPCSTCIVA